jgi:two-component system cell cycle sensor histidine kinase/response regulator CckA
MLKDKSFVTVNFVGSLILIAIVTAVFSYVLVRHQYSDFRTESRAVEAQYMVSQKQMIKDQVNEAIDFINYKKSQLEQRVRDRAKSRVLEAYAIAMSIYKANKDTLPTDKLKAIVREALRPMTFNRGRGYVFAASLDGIAQLHGGKRELEGKDLLGLKDSTGNLITKNLIDIVKQQKEGFYQYDVTKPNRGGRALRKIAFVRYFKPLDWFIGATESVDDMEREIKKEVLKRIGKIRFGKDGYLLVFGFDGTYLSHFHKKYVGKNMMKVTDPNGVKINAELLKISQGPDGGFLRYVWNKPSTGKDAPKLAYAKAFKDWGWVVGTGVYVDDIDNVVAGMRGALSKQIRWQIGLLALLCVGCFVGAALVAGISSHTIRKELEVFTSFFESASTGHEKIDRESLTFSEFRILSDYANRMVEDRKASDDALRKSEANYRQIFDAANDAIFVHDMDTGEIQDVNARMSDMYGFSREEACGLTVEDISSGEPPYTQVEATQWVKRAAQDGPQLFEWLARDEAGRLFWVEVNLKRAVIGGESRILAVVRDISSRKQAEKALREQEESFRTMFEAAQDGIFGVDPKTRRCLLANDSMCKLTGYSREEMLELGVDDIHPKEHLPHVLDRFQLLMEKNITLAKDIPVLRKDRSVIFCDITSGFSRYGDREAFFGFFRDVTDRKSAEDALRQGHQDLEQRVAERTAQLVASNEQLQKEISERRRAEEALRKAHDELEHRVQERTSELRQEIAERKRAEAELLSHISFLEKMERVDHAVRRATSHEEMTGDVLENVLEIFGCDRAWLMDPCDPDAPSYRIPMESTRPEYPGALSEDEDVPMGPDGVMVCRAALDTDGPVTFGPGAARPVPQEVAVPFSVKSLMVMAVYPSLGKPWLFGLHQCSHGRTWTAEEQRLFHEIGHRITLGLSSLLFLRDLRASEKKYRTLFEQSTDAIFIVRPEGEIMDANPACSELLGAPPEEIIGVDIRDFYWDPADRESFRREIEQTGFVSDFEWRVRRKDGDLRTCLGASSAWKDEQGHIIGYLSSGRDVTERMRLEEQLVQSQKMEAVGTLAGGIAHDFNNLLHVIQGYADMALLDMSKEEHGYSEFQEVKRAARSAAELTRGLLTFSRSVESKLRPVNLNHEVNQVTSMLKRTIPRMIDITLDLAADIRTVSADPAQLQQVLMNLALNARDAMPEGGTLSIETRNVHLDREYSKSHYGLKPGEYVLLSVADTGTGMDRKTVEHIFDPFFTTKEAGEGTGLGLSIVYGIIRNHGGNVFCYSEPGEGTVFKIYLPSIETNRQEGKIRQADDLAGGAETILLVDDEESVRMLGEKILTKFGYQVLSASNGREGLEVFARAKDRISLVILDLIMPEMSGRECLAEILKLDPSMRVIIASGYSANGQIDASLEEGAAASIRKPYDARQLLRMVRRVIDET